MAIWRTRSIEEVPEVTLVCWRVFETDKGELHFVGARSERGTGRVSSAIVKFDTSARAGVTRSGRRYVLQGAPGNDTDGGHVWAVWCQVNGVSSYRDVTDSILERRADD